MTTDLNTETTGQDDRLPSAVFGAAPILLTALSTEFGSLVPLFCDLALGAGLCAALLAVCWWTDLTASS